MSTASFYNIPETIAAAMSAAMDVAASEFWAYPDQEWQLSFEADWLASHGYTAAATKARESLEATGE